MSRALGSEFCSPISAEGKKEEEERLLLFSDIRNSKESFLPETGRYLSNTLCSCLRTLEMMFGHRVRASHNSPPSQSSPAFALNQNHHSYRLALLLAEVESVLALLLLLSAKSPRRSGQWLSFNSSLGELCCATDAEGMSSSSSSDLVRRFGGQKRKFFS